jgi:hypothetical protein
MLFLGSGWLRSYSIDNQELEKFAVTEFASSLVTAKPLNLAFLHHYPSFQLSEPTSDLSRCFGDEKEHYDTSGDVVNSK